MSTLRSCLFTTLAWLLLSVPAAGDEMAMRVEINVQVSAMFQKSDFAGLEAMAAEFRDTNARTPSGLQKLNNFHFALGDAAKFSLQYYSDWETVSARADAWVQAYPNSPTAVIGKSVIYSKHAWFIRGGGYASSVDPDAWGPFRDWMSQADEVLLDAKDYASVDPFWYTHRANLMTALNVAPEDFVPVVREGLKRYPTFYQLYFAVIEYLAPKWHGNARMIEEFANDAVEETKATEGNALYARIYWYVSQTQYGFNIFRESDVAWPQMREGIIDVVADYPDQWNVQNFAVFACLAEDLGLTRNLLAQMEEPPIMRAWKKPEILEYCRAFANTN